MHQQISSPHIHQPQSTRQVMQWVLWSTLPGLMALYWQFGWGSIINITLAVITALLCEALVIKLRGRSVAFYLSDYSAVVTAVLLGLALPPLSPWWLVVTASACSIIVAKQLFGGLGYNPFNPAMVGYAVVLISFPVPMTTWLIPLALLPEGMSHPNLIESLSIVFTGVSAVDGVSGATPLESFKHSAGLTVAQIYQQEAIFNRGNFAGAGWEWVNVGFLVGGMVMLKQRLFTWHAPVAMLVTLIMMSSIFWYGGSSQSSGSVVMHLFSGASMMAAFFIVTDPVSSATSTRGRLIYGSLIGLLVFVIRTWGHYPDAVAFAVLLANLCVPLIDHYTLPRTYGHVEGSASNGRRRD